MNCSVSSLAPEQCFFLSVRQCHVNNKHPFVDLSVGLTCRQTSKTTAALMPH